MGWREHVVRYRRDLHRIPELGFQEVKTSRYLADALSGMGLSPVKMAQTGLVADIRGRREGPTIALRADMDGLPLQEETGLAFASEHPGVMHACGHDGHMAIVLACAERLAADRDFPGTVRVLFQPSEERPPGGAPQMIAEGCLEGVDEVLGLHLWASDPVGTASVRSGAIMANADQFRIRVYGRGGHGSEPQATQDAVLIASQIVVNLQTVVARRVSPLEPVVVTCGTIQSGVTFNIIAERAEITGTVRTLSAGAQNRVREEMQAIVEATARMHGARAELLYEVGYPAVINHEASVRRLENSLAGVVTVMHPNPSMGGEDFAYYLHERPGVFFFLGCRPDGDAYPHHSPHFQLNEDALDVGVEALYRSARDFLRGERSVN